MNTISIQQTRTAVTGQVIWGPAEILSTRPLTIAEKAQTFGPATQFSPISDPGRGMVLLFQSPQSGNYHTIDRNGVCDCEAGQLGRRCWHRTFLLSEFGGGEGGLPTALAMESAWAWFGMDATPAPVAVVAVIPPVVAPAPVAPKLPACGCACGTKWSPCMGRDGVLRCRDCDAAYRAKISGNRYQTSRRVAA